MRTLTTLVLVACVVSACGGDSPAPPEAPAPELRVEYYEISKQ